jgi:ABC-type sugar transport system substrate-binding protein
MFIPHEDLFWRDFLGFMETASKQLGLEFEVHLAENDRELMKRQLRKATTGAGRVDAVIFQNFKKCGQDLLKIADDAGVPAFLVNAGVGQSYGAPRKRHANWLGTMESDGEAAGYALACLLADETKTRGLLDEGGKVHMIALAGIVSDAGSSDRVQGLQRAVAERGDIVLHQVVPTDWSREEAKRKAAVLLERFPTTASVWAASDPLALGAVESAKTLGRKPGEDLLLGGFDWTREALEAVESGELYTTIGGHFMEGGWVLVLLHDYFEGRDFAKKQLVFRTPMRPITKVNVGRFSPVISSADWGRFDFLKLTNPAEQYTFDPVETLTKLGPKPN